jgi:hypothetical protein
MFTPNNENSIQNSTMNIPESALEKPKTSIYYLPKETTK